MYIINNNTNYSIVKRGGTKMCWRYNSHYGWNKLARDVVIQLPRNRVKEASRNENRDVIFNDAGSRKTSIDNESTEGPNKVISTEYQHSSYYQSNARV